MINIQSSDEKFYAQRDANFKKKVYDILFGDPVAPYSAEEVLELLINLKMKGIHFLEHWEETHGGT